MLDWNDLSTWNVLIVDDEPDNIEVLVEPLEFFGMTVQTAANGLEAMQVLADFTANLIITDLSMPGMDGWELRSRVKGDPKFAGVPVVALSAHAMAGDRDRALEVGFDGYITKPVNLPTFVQDIKKAVAESRKI